MNRRISVAVAALTVVAVGVSPAMAAKKPKPKPLKGAWAYTDTTPDPTISVLNTAQSLGPHCNGTVPAAPVDVNVHTIKVAGKGFLTVTGDNTLDWAMEIQDAKGHQLANSDGSLPQSKEGTSLVLTKGTYSVIYCNLTGAPTMTATYSFVYS